MEMPEARGPATAALFSLLASSPDATTNFSRLSDAVQLAVARTRDIIRDEDLQLALFCLYELHYRGIRQADENWEWDPRLLAVRSSIESPFEAALQAHVPTPELPAPTAEAVASALFELTGEPGEPGEPSLSHHVSHDATYDQLREFLVQRSIYQLKEADPHSWAIPRLEGRAKAALVEIEADEYGGGRPERMHYAIFAQTMRGLGLDDRYGAYVDHVPGVTLASANMMSLFGLHRRMRGRIVGHLAAFEMTSSIPNRLYGNGFRRLGFGDDVTWYFDEHVEADAVHEQIAARDLAGGLVEAEPALLEDVMFGAAACLKLDGWVGADILSAWKAGISSLRQPLMEAA